MDFMILERMTRAELLAQLAEECMELGHAALKLRRTMEPGASPTPVTTIEANEALREEIADVLLTMCYAANMEVNFNGTVVQTNMFVRDIMREKEARWVTRLDTDCES